MVVPLPRDDSLFSTGSFALPPAGLTPILQIIIIVVEDCSFEYQTIKHEVIVMKVQDEMDDRLAKIIYEIGSHLRDGNITAKEAKGRLEAEFQRYETNAPTFDNLPFVKIPSKFGGFGFVLN